MRIRNNDYETAFVKENMMGPNSLRIEAHDLPFAQEFFDVALSIDSYHYFGVD